MPVLNREAPIAEVGIAGGRYLLQYGNLFDFKSGAFVRELEG